MSKDKVIFKDIKSNDSIVWNNINEATITGGSGAYKPPISLGLKLWDKTSLDPYIEPLSKYVSAELQYDSYDGIMDSKNIKTKEHNAIKISNELKKRQQNQDDDGLGAGRVSISSVGGTSNNVSEDVETLINLLTEDLAVWFGTKKKPKGSKQLKCLIHKKKQPVLKKEKQKKKTHKQVKVKNLYIHHINQKKKV
jgi:hypothetical protein